MSNVYPFLHFLPPRDRSRSLQPPQVRDETACRELVVSLMRRGFGYGEPLLNFPPPTFPGRLLEENELLQVDVSFLEPGDFLVCATRPPIHDIDHGDKKRMEPGNTDLERRIFAAWRTYLEVCARSHVKLARGPQDALPEGFEGRRDMAFLQGGGGNYKELNDLEGSGWRPPPPNRTAAFLLRVEELPGGGPGLIHSFGTDAMTSLAFAYRLGRDFAYLLDEPGFSLLEIERAPVPERPTNLRWALEWKIQPLIEHFVQ
jgi:hypothetical protein